MKNRWQDALEAAAAAYDTPMPWARGAQRNAMIKRRQENANDDDTSQELQARGA